MDWGPGFSTLLVRILAGLAILVLVATVAGAVYKRRAGYVPRPFGYVLAVLCVGVVGVSGFGVLVLYDEASVLAWLFASIALVPFLVVGPYLARTARSFVSTSSPRRRRPGGFRFSSASASPSG